MAKRVNMVNQKLELINLSQLEGPLQGTIEKLSKFATKYAGKDLRIALDCDDDGASVFQLVEQREETDEERRQRVFKYEENKAWRRKHYEQLKKEFEA